MTARIRTHRPACCGPDKAPNGLRSALIELGQHHCRACTSRIEQQLPEIERIDLLRACMILGPVFTVFLPTPVFIEQYRCEASAQVMHAGMRLYQHRTQ